MRTDRERLLDILDAIEKIERYTGKGREEFEKDELLQVWVLHHIQIIGEAASNISDEFKEGASHILWAAIVAMRNILVHEYFGIDLNEVWRTVQKDLPVLMAQV